MMKTMSELCEMICLPKEVTDRVIAFDSEFDYEVAETAMNLLFSRETWVEGRNNLKEILGSDDHGFKILTCMLHCMGRSYEMYLDKGISERIFIDSMKCFTRFIQEHKVSYGEYAFDRDWWTARQIALQLFRIGELEYEFKEQNEEKVISLHIPSDAKLTVENCRKSYEESREFTDRYFPEYRNQPYVCNSWLLSKQLIKLLPDTSNILRFQQQFDIMRECEGDGEELEWVFKRKDIPYTELPENTTLQKNMKKFLLEGGKIGLAYGVLKEQPWC